MFGAFGSDCGRVRALSCKWYKWRFFCSRDEFRLTPVTDFVARVEIALPLGYQKQGPIQFDLKADDGMGLLWARPPRRSPPLLIMQYAVARSDGALTCERFGYGESEFKVKITFSDADRPQVCWERETRRR
jgi:hypothetical protein